MSSSLPPANPEAAISLRSVTKTFTIWDNPAASFFALARRLLGLGGKPTGSRFFTAVQEVTLDILPGECLGIIGRNGAGKSTLLQMIAGTLQPTTGKVKVNGRVAALLELGSGFNPDFTGRENVHLNAAILGLSQPEIAAKFDSIVAYSGIEEFIDQPVRTYSSGMTLRLAFAVCVHVDASIVIIDEALAVGDARFQFKCHATLDQMLKNGVTIIFVSHDTNAVKRLCRTAVLLERGEVLLKGTPNEVTNIYTKLITSPQGLEGIRADIAALQCPAMPENHKNESLDTMPSSSEQGASTPGASPAPPSGLIDAGEAGWLVSEERSHQQISDKEYSYGGELGRIISVQLTDEHDHPKLSFLTGSRIRVHFSCEASTPITDPIYALTLKAISGQEIFGTNTYFQNQSPPSLSAGAKAEVTFDLGLNVLPGIYFISLGWVRLEDGEVQVIHRRYDVLRFDVLARDRSFGIAYCPTTITVA